MSLASVPQTQFSPGTTKPSLARYLRIKRALDLGICIFMLPVLLPLVALLALLIVLDSPGSPFFVQERVGKDRRVFRLVKFRTMRSDHDDRRDREYMQAYISGRVDADGAAGNGLFKPIKRQDITAMGRFLRRTSLDELTQVYNVLKGEMSLVGPRPNVPWEVEAYEDWHYERLAVLPGITGLAQVRGRSALTFDEIARHDIEYVRRLSLLLDLRILWQTVVVLVTGQGAG